MTTVTNNRFMAVGQWIQKGWKSLWEETGPKNTITSLDGVRAIACLLVITYHISLITRDTRVWSVTDPTHRLLTGVLLSGYSGVTLFFVLSGFLLFLPYARALLFAEKWPSARQFYLRRALRIIPAYYVALFVLLLFPALQPQPLKATNPLNVGLFLTFLMDSTKATFGQIDGPFWTLAVEWQFYMLLPLFALGMQFLVSRCFPRRRGLAVVLFLIGLMAWGVFSRYLSQQFLQNPAQGGPAQMWQNIWLFVFYGGKGKFLEDFAVGMLICLMYVYAQNKKGLRLSATLQQRSFWLWGSGLFLLFYVATTWPWSIFTVLPVYPYVAELLLACGFGLCTLAVLFNAPILQPIFSWRPLCALGRISYSLYMWHLPILVLLMVNVGYRLQGGNGFLIYMTYWIGVVGIIIPFCALFYGLFEKPGMRLAARLRKRNPPPPVAPRPSMSEEHGSASGLIRQAAHVEV